jgi:hypothetical protein
VTEGQDLRAITAALAAPFDPREVRFRAGPVRGGKALALAYVDARAVQDRLDEVLGVTGWQDEYECLPDGSVVCRLRLKLGPGWITKADVGGASDQPDQGDRRKAALSDALKRAAVKFGIGRYLYRLPRQWLDYDPHTGQFLGTPRLPAWALPRVLAQGPARHPGAGAHAGPGFINESQRRHLLELLSAKGYSPRKLAQRYGVQDLAELTRAQYEHAAGSLARLPDREVAR